MNSHPKIHAPVLFSPRQRGSGRRLRCRWGSNPYTVTPLWPLTVPNAVPYIPSTSIFSYRPAISGVLEGCRRVCETGVTTARSNASKRVRAYVHADLTSISNLYSFTVAANRKCIEKTYDFPMAVVFFFFTPRPFAVTVKHILRSSGGGVTTDSKRQPRRVSTNVALCRVLTHSLHQRSKYYNNIKVLLRGLYENISDSASTSLWERAITRGSTNRRRSFFTDETLRGGECVWLG